MKPNPKLLIQALSAALVLVHFASCKSENPGGANTRHAVDPSLANNVPFRNFDIDANAGDMVKLAEGTYIYIPGGLFIDKAGKAVTGRVQLHYRAFYTPGEILASGITMLYDTAGEQHLFSSAGMFELTGTQNGDPVTIAPGKSIQMDFASTYNDVNFNFYELDTANAAWNFLATTTADSNKLRQSLEKALAVLPRRPSEPKEYNPKTPSINMDVDITDHPELAGYSDVIWQYAGKGNDPEKNKWIYDTDWTSAKLLMTDDNTCMYNMTLANSEKSFSTSVFPTLKGANFKTALADFKTKMQAFEASERDRQEKRKQLEETTQFQRSLSIARFGIHNCDIFNIFGKRKRKRVQFHFADKAFEDARADVAVYVIVADGRAVTCYNGESEVSMTYFETGKNCIVAVLRGTNKAAILRNDEFMTVVSSGDEDVAGTLMLESTNDKVENSKDLDALISKL